MACRFEQSLRSKEFVRPKPLRRGEGVGGGNYVKLGARGVVVQRREAVTTARPPPRRRPSSAESSRPSSRSTSASTPSTSKENVCPSTSRTPRQSSAPKPRPSSAPRLYGASRTPMAGSSGAEPRPGPSTSRARPPSALECEPGPSTYRPSPPRATECLPGPSTSRVSPPRAMECEPGPSSRVSPPRAVECDPGPSTSKACTSQAQGRPSTSRATPKRPSTPRAGPPSSRPPSRGSSSARNPPASSSRPPSRGSVSARKPQASTSRPPSRPSTAPNARKPPTTGPPSGGRKPPSADRRPGPSCLRPPPGQKRNVQFTGVPPPGPGPSPDTRTKYFPKKPRVPLGPSLYPIFPDQYEAPLRSIPGPRQVLLMPGDINPNETTIIDIVGLDEGDIQSVPCIPPHAPKTLLEEGRKRLEEEAKAAAAAATTASGRKRPVRRRILPNKKCPKGKFDVGEGRAFSAQKFGHVNVKELPLPLHKGYLRPDPECAREMPFRSRKTTRPFLDEEIEEIEQARAFRAIRCILQEADARILSDRAARGLSDDDLIDIDAEVETPTRVRKAPRDIYAKTNRCKYPRPSTPPQRMSPICTTDSPAEEDLIAWDDDVEMPYEQDCDPIDYMSDWRPGEYGRTSTSGSPMLMDLDEPEEDLLGLCSPRTRVSPLAPRADPGDLMQWHSPMGGALPFDEGYEDDYCDPFPASPTAANLRTPPLSSMRGQVSNQGYMMVCQPQCPSAIEGETRIVRAVPLENDPTTVVLENSPLAREAAGGGYDEEEDCLEEDDSYGLLGNELCEGEEALFTEEDFHRPLRTPAQIHSRGHDMSGVREIDECDDDDLGLLDADWLDDFSFDPQEDQRFRAKARYQTLFQPLAQGAEMLEDEDCPPTDYGMEALDNEFERERADFLHLECSPDVSFEERQFGRLGSELVDQCRCPIEQYTDLLGLYTAGDAEPQRRPGKYTKELLEACPDDQQLVDVSEECPKCPPPPPPPPSFGYSKDLFTNVQWDPCMAPKPPSESDGICPD